jgi:hypothetical protein
MLAVRRLDRVAVALSILNCAAVCTAAADVQSAELTYEDAARTSRETFANGTHVTGQILPRKRTDGQKRDLFFGERLGDAAHDCSDWEYRCLYVQLRVYAVPRRRLLSGATYEAAGAKFRVEDCLRGDGRLCQVALISSIRPVRPGEGYEQWFGKAGAGGLQSPIVYFIYNEDFGVTAFGMTFSPAQSAADRMVAATDKILQSKVGLLAGP